MIKKNLTLSFSASETDIVSLNYNVRGITVRYKALRLACWNADGVRGRKLELEHFLSKHGVEIFLLSETFLNPDQAFRLANYVCHRTDRPTTVQPS